MDMCTLSCSDGNIKVTATDGAQKDKLTQLPVIYYVFILTQVDYILSCHNHNSVKYYKNNHC